jgi:hypothetical protein
MDQFNRLEQFAKLQRPPSVKFHDLEAMVSSKITYNILPMQVRVDYVRVTNSSVYTNITVLLKQRDLQFKMEDGVQKSTVNIFGRITSMARRAVSTFEEVVSTPIPPALMEEAMKGQAVFGKSIPLAPGTYRLNVVAKDIVGGNMNNYEVALHVPRYDDETLAASSLILADVLEKVPTRSIGTGQFVIGDLKVRPRVDDAFQKSEKMGVYVQLYNFAPDEKTQKPNGTIQYEVVRDGTNEKIFDFSEEVTAIEGASANQVTIEKLLPLQNLEPGKYTLKMKVVDRNKNQTLTTSANFRIF